MSKAMLMTVMASQNDLLSIEVDGIQIFPLSLDWIGCKYQTACCSQEEAEDNETHDTHTRQQGRVDREDSEIEE